jgi:hypothetical protein
MKSIKTLQLFFHVDQIIMYEYDLKVCDDGINTIIDFLYITQSLVFI